VRIVVAPDSFKDCLTAHAVAEAISVGLRRALPSASVDLVPMADGGQGTVAAVLASTGGERRTARVTGPLGQPVEATFALLQNRRLGLMEMASASGLELVPSGRRDPMKTTTLGTGELMRAVLDSGVERLLIGIGGSATNDGGIGMAQALGYRILDAQGRDVPPGGEGLLKVATIDPTHRDPRLGKIPIDVACDVTNPLTGPDGASAVYGPQKGANPAMVESLDQGLAKLATLVERDLGCSMDAPGAGAAGGLGGGLVAFASARLRRGVDIVIDAVGLRERLRDADLCVTGEGRMDEQSSFGKTASGVAETARSMGVPVVALVGSRAGQTDALHALGVSAIFDITPGPIDLAHALAQAPENLAYAAEQVIRLWLASDVKRNRGG
jgi:glycerate kinase